MPVQNAKIAAIFDQVAELLQIGGENQFCVRRLPPCRARHRGPAERNAEPDRLDLNDLHANAAKLAGAKLAVSTDAHSIDAFQCMRFGIDQARRV